MAESRTHLKLVEALVSWIAGERFHGERGCILVDGPDSPAHAKPTNIAGFVPDVYAQDLDGGGIVIGEAKTARDLENRHTRDQLGAFLPYCAARPGALFVLAVPWHATRYARHLLAIVGRTCSCESVSTVVLEQLEG